MLGQAVDRNCCSMAYRGVEATRMPDVDWSAVNWIRYTKHRKATRRTWDASIALKMSKRHKSQAQYNPILYGQNGAIEQLERMCIEHGTVVFENKNSRKCYMVRTGVVGMCSGERTNIVYAEWARNVGLHGRPISPAALNRNWQANV